MKFKLIEPSFGDIVRVSFGNFYHYGIFVSEKQIIQFGLAPTARPQIRDSEVEVVSSDVYDFLQGNFMEVAVLNFAERHARNSPEKTVEIALSRMGEKGYNIIHNNCEHFVNECVFGKKSCSQADDVRKLFRSMPILNVYVCPIFEREIDLSCVYPTERANQISECSNKKVRLEKYLVWKLLEYALEHTFGKKITDVKFKKEPTGKWTCNFCEFSLSHTDGAVAVAISRKAVGVDIEGLKKLKSQTVFDRILSEDEKKLLANSSNEQKERLFYEFWTKKESAFKQLNKNTCEYKKLPTLSQRVKTQTININDNSYILSVASDCLEKLKLFTVDLK